MTQAPSLLGEIASGPGPAVVGSATLTYDELGALANRIAHAIAEVVGEERGMAVALLLDHDTLAVAAALGAVRAGGHYVALHPTEPVERAAFVLADAGAPVLLTEPRHADVARELADRSPRCVTVLDVTAVDHRPATAPAAAPAPTDRALLVYTSGSTGWPKGVWHDHASIIAGASAYGAMIDAGPAQRLSLLHSLVTMAGATTLWTGLLHGATIVLCDPRRASPARLLDRIATTGVTGLHLVPTLFRKLAAEPSAADRLAGIRFVRLGGEAMTRGDWDLFRRCCGSGSRLHVGFASTETGLVRHGVFHRFRPPPRGAVLPLGDAVPGKELVLVDEHGAPVPAGQVGRVVVRGRHMFGGYHGREAETAAVRRVEPDGTVVYVSGDLARRDRRRRFFHAGRGDGLVKIDGHRVEPAEVEHALRELPWVREAAVVPRMKSGSMRLAAFVVPGEADVPDRRSVRAQLRGRLPSHMVPAAVKTLDALPTLPDGKVDRRALVRRPLSGNRWERPSNHLEETLLEVFKRVLEAPSVSVDDDFFLDLGGDSLDAVQVVDEIAELFGEGLVLEVLAETRSVRGLAAKLTEGGWPPPIDDALVVHGHGSRPPLFGIGGKSGHALRVLSVGLRLADDQPLHALQPPGMDWSTAGCTTIEEMAAHYCSVIRARQPNGPYRLIGTSFGGVMVFAVACRLEADGEEVDVLAMVDTAPPDVLLADGIDRAPRRAPAARPDPGDPLRAMGRRVARQHLAAKDRYVIDAPFSGGIVFFACSERAAAAHADRRGLWAHAADGGVEVVPLPGWHGQFHLEPQLSVLVGELRRRLSPAAERG